MTAFHWIRNTEKEYKVWVQNRVTAIRKFTSTETWRYYPTQFNPVDVASRGALALQLINDENWWHGPSFLQNPEELWPVLPIKEPENSPDYCEELKSNIPKRTAMLVSVGIKPEFDLEQLIDPSRNTAYILRFVRNLQSRRRKLNPIKGPITTDEINLAEKMWIRQIQVSLPKKKDYKKLK